MNEKEDKQQKGERKGKMICNRKVGRSVSRREWQNSNPKASKKSLIFSPIKLSNGIGKIQTKGLKCAGVSGEN